MTLSHQHRASNTLKQSNKKHKSTLTSKRSTKLKQGGKISDIGNSNGHRKKLLNAKHKIGTITKRSGNEKGSKKVRRFLQKQKLKIINGFKQQSEFGFGDSSKIPSIVTVINLSSRNELNVEDVVSNKIKSISSSGTTNKDSTVYYYPSIKNGLRIYSSNASSSSSNNDLISILDQCRISNHIIFVISNTINDNSVIDDRTSYISKDAEIILSGIKAQGLPLSNLHVLYINSDNNNNIANKKKKYVQRLMNAEFPSSNIKVYNDAVLNDYRMLLRCISNSHNNSTSKFIQSVPRSYIVSEDGWEYDHSSSSNKKELHIKGYIRNAPLNPKHLLHVANIGTCVIRKVCHAADPTILLYQSHQDNDINVNGIEFANPNALEGEQNLVGFDEVDDHHQDNQDDEDDEMAEKKESSDYFSPWFDIIDSKQELDDHKSLINAFNTPSVSDAIIDEDDENNYNHRKQFQQQDQKFPDELDMQPNELASERLARYRSLKSFRKSYIDPKENLPEDYCSVFHFQNFKGTRKDVLTDVIEEINDSIDDHHKDDHDVQMKDDDAATTTPSMYIPIGTHIIITVSVNTATTNTNLLQQLSTTTKPLLSATTLLPHENKVSVLHMSLSPIPIANEGDKPPIVKSKDIITIRCGWRTFQAKPIFSQHNLNCDKHKLERFMPNNGFCSMTVYGPVTYTPTPILLFQNNTLVASGNLSDIDADRIIIKRCVITGYPTRVHKRWATVKYMFYNPDDVKWFKPAELMTKQGLHGNIMESIGEHGSMKCLFNQPIKQHDTVCLPLYKRVYPKFVPTMVVNNDSMDDAGTQKTTKLDLVVW